MGLNASHPSKYAKVVIDDRPSLPADMPSFKVMIHEQLAASASNSIEGSTILAKEISKSLVVDLFRSNENPRKFGILLGDIFKFDNIRSPTRELIYWSIQTDSTIGNLNALSSSAMVRGLAVSSSRIYSATWMVNFIKDAYFFHDLSLPYFSWLLKDHEYCINPLISLASYFIPLQKVCCHHRKTAIHQIKMMWPSCRVQWIRL